MTWLKRLLWSPPEPGGLEVLPAVPGGAQVCTCNGKVVIGIMPRGGVLQPGQATRLAVLSPAAARALAFDLWDAARAAALERVH